MTEMIIICIKIDRINLIDIKIFSKTLIMVHLD